MSLFDDRFRWYELYASRNHKEVTKRVAKKIIQQNKNKRLGHIAERSGTITFRARFVFIYLPLYLIIDMIDIH